MGRVFLWDKCISYKRFLLYSIRNGKPDSENEVHETDVERQSSGGQEAQSSCTTLRQRSWTQTRDLEAARERADTLALW